jgi:cell division transport system ATP-binding protein
VIEAINLSKLYGRGVYALRDLSMRVDKGEFVFLTGPSGAGKSTLLRLLLRRDVPTDGQLVVNGRDLASLTTTEVQAYRRSLGFVFQDFKLLPTKTVLENVAFVPHVLGMAVTQQQRRTFQVLKWVGLQHRMNAFPMELSGGEQQRIAIARALVNNPAILLADEPTGNLDSMNSTMILELFKDLNRRLGQTIMMITHNPEAAAEGHRSIEMRDGRVVSHGILPQLVTGAGT